MAPIAPALQPLINQAPARPAGGYTNQHLVDNQTWSRLTARISRDREFLELFRERPEDERARWAERIFSEALGFLDFCGNSPVGGYGPSTLVDIGWHVFMVYTREYAAFCDRTAGRFIHHSPNDIPGKEAVGFPPRETAEAMQRAGRTVDLVLWDVDNILCFVTCVTDRDAQARATYNCTGGGDSGPAGNCTCS
jgi:hypothetical protein